MNPLLRLAAPVLLACVLLPGAEAALRGEGKVSGVRPSAASTADVSARWPDREQWRRVLLLRDYNTRVVVGGTSLLGVAAGVIGSFTLLRKRALMGDALSHAMLPGIGLAFMLSVAAGGTGKALPVLLAGAMLSGALGFAVVLFLRRFTRLKEDTALGIVLSVFFGAGIAVLGIVQRMGQGHAAGLESFIYGKTASLVASDVALIAVCACGVLVMCTLWFKEFKLLCFDAEYAASLGWSTVALDGLMLLLVIGVTVIGLQAVGLILIIAMLIIPAAAARFWTERLVTMIFIAAAIGAASAAIGAAGSALLPDLPSGAMIVLVGVALFLASMVLGTERGVLVRAWQRRQLELRIRRQHLLRAAYELLERAAPTHASTPDQPPPPIPFQALLRLRSWSPRVLRREIARAARAGLAREMEGEDLQLTPAGFAEAARLARQHRLWELYLITHADIAASHVDRDADAIEHVLGAEMVNKLEALLTEPDTRAAVPASPHALGPLRPR